MHFKRSKKTEPDESISYIVPAFNCEETICAAVNSILDGNFSDGDEIIVTNDASTDRTSEIAARLSVSIKDMRIIHHQRNLGGGAARNAAVAEAKNDLIFCLDSDNLLLPCSVPKLAVFLRENRADAAAFGGQKFFKVDPRAVSHEWSYKPGQIRLSDLLCGYINPASSGNYIFTRKFWFLAGKYPDWAGALDTWGFGLRQIGCGGKLLTMPNSCYLHRWGHESYWVRWSQEAGDKQRSAVALKLLSPYLEMLAVPSQRRATSEGQWFESLSEYPLVLKSGEQGVDGVSHRTVTERARGIVEEIRQGDVKSAISRRLNRLKRRIVGDANHSHKPKLTR